MVRIPIVCPHGAAIRTQTRMFIWYTDNCAITRAAILRGESPKPQTIIIAKEN